MFFVEFNYGARPFFSQVDAVPLIFSIFSLFKFNICMIIYFMYTLQYTNKILEVLLMIG